MARAVAAAPLAVLAKVERGRWQFKVIGAALGRDVCAPDPLRLVQFNHPGPAARRFTIEDAADHVTIQYNCGPRGYGKTTITLTQPGQIRLDTQGIDPAAGRSIPAMKAATPARALRRRPLSRRLWLGAHRKDVHFEHAFLPS